VRHDQSAAGGWVGLYIERQGTHLEKGVLHTFLQLGFTEFDDEAEAWDVMNRSLPPNIPRPPRPKGNSVNLRARLYAEGTPGPGCDMELATVTPAEFKPARLNPRPWRQIAVTVTAEEIRASFDGQEMAVAAAQLAVPTREQAGLLLSSYPQEANLRDNPPHLRLAGGVGLCVYRSSASFRRVVLERLPEAE
jgi:hypothetical protein